MSSELADAVFEAIEQVTEPLFARIKALEAEIATLKSQPTIAGPPGPAGRDGVDGKDGAPGRDGVDGRDGKDGERGLDGAKGLDGKDGRDGVDGKDGIGVSDAVIDREGALVLTLANGQTKTLGVVVGQKGEPGKDGQDGRDGFGFDDFTAEYDGERTITLTFQRGELVKTFPFELPIVIDRGVYVAGKTYQPGEGVTWGGSFWIAQKQTSAKPGDGSGGWRLAVKKGSDGKQGPMGPEGKPGPRGEQGPMGPKGY